MEITSRKNEKVLHIKKLGASRDYRRERGEFYCDGWKLLEEAVKWNADIHDVFVCGQPALNLPTRASVYNVTREVIESVSPLKTPQNVVFTVGIPNTDFSDSIAGSVVLEDMQDPGNVGTMIRTANAFGISQVVLAGACADPWSPKTARASMGAVFREKIVEMSLDELIKVSRKTPIIGAALSNDAIDLRRADLTGCAVAIGNEGNGLSDRLLDACAGRLIIPMKPECESLNAAAAAAVIMWEMARNNI